MPPKNHATASKRQGAPWGAGSPASKSAASARKRDNGMGDFGRYMANKVRKLGEQFQADASNPESHRKNAEAESGGEHSKIFEGVSIHVNGYTTPSHQELRILMLRHGGNFENYFSKARVTHIICSNLPQSKINDFRSFSKGLPVLRPGWIVDSIAAGELLPWATYQLETTPNQQKLPSFYASQRKLLFETGEKEEKPQTGSSQHEDTENTPRFPERDTLYGELEINNATNGEREINDVTDGEGEINDVTDGALYNEDAFELLERERTHSTLDDPNFVQNYFKYSRLHFIGTWRNRYHGNPKLQKGVTLDAASEKSIIHVDMDCFFVSVVTRNRPELEGKPVAVCHSDSSKGTAEISSANYEARAYGVRAGMFVRDARNSCPNLDIVPYDFDAYEKVADKVYEILHQHSPLVQAISCDEAYLDVSGMGDPTLIASEIRRKIFEATRCTASAGISSNLLLSRLATKKAKPNGQYSIHLHEAEHFMKNLSVEDLPGVGWALREKLHSHKLFTCADLATLSIEMLRTNFGYKTGETLYNYARGIDHRKVQPAQDRKSIGAEVNWGVRFSTPADAQKFLVTLSEEVSSRLKAAAMQGRTFTMKVKKRKPGTGEPEKFMGCGICDNISRSVTLPSGTNASEILLRVSRQLFGALNLDVRDIRGVGLQTSRLEPLSNDQGTKEQKRLESWLHTSPQKKSENFIDSIPGPSIELPPLSEIDPTFLASLPPELFAELNDAYKGALNLSKLGENGRETGPRNETEIFKGESSHRTAEITVTQVDKAVLAELPTQLQREVLEHFPRSRSEPKYENQGEENSLWTNQGSPRWAKDFQTSEFQVLRDISEIYTSLKEPKYFSQVLVALSATSREETESHDSIAKCSEVIIHYLQKIVPSDLEEASAVVRLLRRLSTKWDFWKCVYSRVSPMAQDQVLRLYDGYLK